MSSNRPFIIGVAGGSGSGKTTVVKNILQEFKDTAASIVQHDWYYKNHSDLSLEERAKLNYDHPDALETNLLVEHVKVLLENKSVECPIYDFTKHERKIETQLVKPTEILIVDGILVLNDPALRDLMDMKVFVDTDSDMCFIRRMERDISHRGRSRESVIEQYLTTVKPMHDQFVEPSKRFADVIIPRGGKNKVAIDLIVTKISSILK